MTKAMQTVNIEDYAAETTAGSKAAVIRATATPLAPPASTGKTISASGKMTNAGGSSITSMMTNAGGSISTDKITNAGITSMMTNAGGSSITSMATNAGGSSSSSVGSSASGKKSKPSGKKRNRATSNAGTPSIATPPSATGTPAPFYVPPQQLTHAPDLGAPSIEMTLNPGSTNPGGTNPGAAPTMAFDLSAADISVNIVSSNAGSSKDMMLASGAQQRDARVPNDPTQHMAPPLLAQLPAAVVRNDMGGDSMSMMERPLPAQFQTQTAELLQPVPNSASRPAVGRSLVQVPGQSAAQPAVHSMQPATHAVPPVTPLAAPKMFGSMAPQPAQQQQLQPHAMVANFNRPATPMATAAATAVHAPSPAASTAHAAQTSSAVQPPATTAQRQPNTPATTHALPATTAAAATAATTTAAANPTHATSLVPDDRAPAEDSRHQTNHSNSKGGPRLSDGFIVLISIAIMFVCALLFYFYMRQRRRRQRLALHRAAHTSLLHSSSLSLPGAANPGQADKFSRVLTRDSGTSLSLREPRMEEKLFPVTTPRDAQVEALDRRYLDYRSGTGMAQSLVDARHARFGGPAVRHAGAISFDTVAPLRARLPPSPLQHQQPLDGNSSSSSSKRDATPATPAHASVSASAACSQRSLLDTSAANPSLAAGAGNASKPRKLLRDTCRTAGGGNASTTSSSAGSPVASPDQSSGSSKTAKPASPLLDSIESISDSYQFAVRHRPPLGPLRVVEPHVPALADELAVDRGHHMFVVGEFADGWVLAVNISRNSECGMIPRRCLFFPTAAFMTHDALASA